MSDGLGRRRGLRGGKKRVYRSTIRRAAVQAGIKNYGVLRLELCWAWRGVRLKRYRVRAVWARAAAQQKMRQPAAHTLGSHPGRSSSATQGPPLTASLSCTPTHQPGPGAAVLLALWHVTCARSPPWARLSQAAARMRRSVSGEAGGCNSFKAHTVRRNTAALVLTPLRQKPACCPAALHGDSCRAQLPVASCQCSAPRARFAAVLLQVPTPPLSTP